MATVLVSGANRGLGLEFSRQYAAHGWRVLATCRHPDTADDLRSLEGSVEVFPLDVSDFDAIADLATTLKGTPIDVLINNAGIFGPKILGAGEPGQTFEHIDYAAWARIMRVNMFAPVRMAEAFIDNVVASDQKKIVSISSIMGSIASTEGGYYLYRTSKAGLNMAMATLARDVHDRGVSVAVFCPGFVKTDMGGAMANITPETSIAGLRRRIEELSLETSGQFFHRYNGDALPW
jgi:NAD(P)-dependent dehydrogenase (short-subunit alcohol dehydrogenase family)